MEDRSHQTDLSLFPCNNDGLSRAADMVERRTEVFARMSELKEAASVLADVFADKARSAYMGGGGVPA